MLTINQLNNLRDAATHAHSCELVSKVPSELIIPQWALESGWGAHSPGNNCFGIKEYQNCYGRQLLYTREYFTDEELYVWLRSKQGRSAELENGDPDSNGRKRYKCRDYFATFQTLAHCFMKRAELFHTARYQPALNQYIQSQNFVVFVQAIAKDYATDPKYSDVILELASMPEVQAAIKENRG